MSNLNKSHKVHHLNRFTPNEYVVLPGHGVGKFVEAVEIGAMDVNEIFYKVNFLNDNMEILVPQSNLEQSGLRKIVSKDIAEKVFDIVSKPPKHHRGVWNKRMQEYDAKICSGVLSNLAEVVRDGFVCSIDQNKSYTERNKYKIALQRVCEEVSVALKQTFESIETKILSILRSSQSKTTQEDEFNMEFEDVDMETIEKEFKKEVNKK